MSVIHPVAEIMAPSNVQKDLENDEIDIDIPCWREVFKTRDTRKMGKTARCLTLFHNLTIMIALLLTLFQYYEAASISLVASMVALFRVQQEEDEKFDSEDLCVAEIQQTKHSSLPRKKRRKKRKTQQRGNSIVDSRKQAGQPRVAMPITSAVSKPTAEIKEPVAPNAVIVSQTTPLPERLAKSTPKITKPVTSNSTAPPPPPPPPPRATPIRSEDLSTKSDAVETVGHFLSDEDTMTEAFDDEVAKFRARLETIQSTADRPKIHFSAGVFAKQLAAKKSAARSRTVSHKTFSI